MIDSTRSKDISLVPRFKDYSHSFREIEGKTKVRQVYSTQQYIQQRSYNSNTTYNIQYIVPTTRNTTVIQSSRSPF